MTKEMIFQAVGFVVCVIGGVSLMLWTVGYLLLKCIDKWVDLLRIKVEFVRFILARRRAKADRVAAAIRTSEPRP